MSDTDGLELLFQCACDYKFDEFDALFSELEARLSPEIFWEAYLLRLQIKLYAADATLADDLKKATATGGAPRFPCLNNYWRCDTPNRLCVFSKTPGTLRSFLQTLPHVEEEMRRWHGEIGGSMVCQVQSELLYFMGSFDEAILVAKAQRDVRRENDTDAVCSLIVLFRCYLATGVTDEAEQCMLEMARLSKAKPECVAPYESTLMWTNLTTGWRGDSPRYAEAPGGTEKPVFEDRLDAIRSGYALISPLENPFVSYAMKRYPDTHTMRQYYMDIFHTIYWFQVKDYRQTKSLFSQIFQVAAGSGLIAPLAEYGKQIVPLLQHAKGSGVDCSDSWIDNIIALAEQYEAGLNAYRS